MISFDHIVNELNKFLNTEIHPGDDPLEVIHGHHCCKGDCWHHQLKNIEEDLSKNKNELSA